MAVEITISRVTEKMKNLLARSGIMYLTLPTLRTRLNRSIKLLEKCLDFLKGLTNDGRGNTSTINVWNNDLLKAMYRAEKDIDSFLVRTALTKASAVLYVKSFSNQSFLSSKMKFFVHELEKISEKIQEMSSKSDGVGDLHVENLGDSQLQQSAFEDAADGRPDQEEQDKLSEDMVVPPIDLSSNNSGDSLPQQSTKSKDFGQDDSEQDISDRQPEQEQAKLSEDIGAQPTDSSSNNFGVIKDVGEVNSSDGRHNQEQVKLLRTDLGDAESEIEEVVEDTSEPKTTEDLGAPPIDLSSWKDSQVPPSTSEINAVTDSFPTVRRNVSDGNRRRFQRLESTSSHLDVETTITPRKRFHRLETFSYLDAETKIVGLKDQLQELSQLTLNPYAKYFLISVVGRAGSGKTLLVRQIFNQSQTKQNFEKLAFISVSQNFKEREMLAEILRQVAGTKDQEKLSFAVLQQKLRDFLARKRYLIVLDDVHTIDVWNKIKLAFPNSLKGSRVILTIRDANVARRIAPAIVLLHLRPLTDEESWKLFLTRVKTDTSESPEFKNLKQEILHECKGLPLQILVLGGVLASKKLTTDEWSKVLKQIKEIGKEEKKRAEDTKRRKKEPVIGLPYEQGEIQEGRVIEEHVKPKKQDEKKESGAAPEEDKSNSPDQSVSEDSLDPSNILALGFQDLSSTLRECFHYLCLFPKSREIRTRRLFQLWLAEGLVPTTGDTNAAGDAVERYIDDLEQRNMIEVAELGSDGRPKTCRVPDTLYDTFISDASDLGFHHIYGDSDLDHTKSNIRRFAGRLDLQHNLTSDHIQDVRSYICFYEELGDRPAEEVENFINKTLIRRGFGLLTVLDLEHVYKPVLPKTLGKVLPLLKYVGLRWTFLDSIPESVGDLHYLETLDVKHTNITRLPISIWKAQELQHLYMNEIPVEISIRESSSGPYLSKLQTLRGLLIGNKNPPIKFLEGLTSIRKLGLTCHTESLKKLASWICQLDKLRSLRLRAINEFRGPSDIHLGSMVNHKELTDLYLLGKLPRAIGISELPPKLTNLTLSLSQLSADPMEMLGQLTELKVLKLLAHSYIEKDMTCSRLGFPKLQVLKLWMLTELEKWILEPGAMPELKELEIRYCPKLNKPEGLENLKAEEVTLTNMGEDFVAEFEASLGKKIKRIDHDFNPKWN